MLLLLFVVATRMLVMLRPEPMDKATIVEIYKAQHQCSVSGHSVTEGTVYQCTAFSNPSISESVLTGMALDSLSGNLRVLRESECVGYGGSKLTWIPGMPEISIKCKDRTFVGREALNPIRAWTIPEAQAKKVGCQAERFDLNLQPTHYRCEGEPDLLATAELLDRADGQ